ncbi:hypothetical protein QFC21_002872 [Naganishia friedmannii]|uniref:Uncharacterized protein n=1 Tax=Naganishia friedmannii TaxID=89922 RepID=A0ACC2VT01_9TREE|nr:hypothetical protein QFC21_002872 [Naganishia friedmannii]
MNTYATLDSHHASNRNIYSNAMDTAKRGVSLRPRTAQQPSPLTPPITSPNSRASASSSGHHSNIHHDVGRLPSFGGVAHALASRQSTGQSNTGWGAARYESEDYEGQTYGHDMASQYFALAHIPEQQVNARGQPVISQRIMSRVRSNYPLPCDDQEQQISDPQPWSYGLHGRTLRKAGIGYRHGREREGGWAIEMAEQYPASEMTGPSSMAGWTWCRYRPGSTYLLEGSSNRKPARVPFRRFTCSFEVYDVNDSIPYPDATFDLCHVRFARLGIRDFASLLAEISRVLKTGGTLIIFDNAFPMDISLPNRDFVATICPGLKSFQDAVKWSIAQRFSSLSGHEYSSMACKNAPIMDADQIAGLVAYTERMIDTKACQVMIPLGCTKTEAHLRTVSQMAMQNTLALAAALKPTVMSQGKYSSQDFESFLSADSEEPKVH